MAGIVLLALIGFSTYLIFSRGMKHDRVQTAAMLPPGLKEAEQKRLEERARARRRLPGAPRVHRAAFRKILPFAPLLIAPLVLTAVFALDPIALSLMTVGIAAFASVIFYFLNLEARAEYNETHETETYVASAVAGLDEFHIPEDWSRRYL